MGHSLRAGATVLALLSGLALAAAQTEPGRTDAGPVQDANGPRGDTSPAGSEPPHPPDTAATPAGPLGATPQTMPSTLSAENAALDRVPTMAHALPLTDAQKRTIRDVIGATPAPAALISADPAEELSVAIELNDLPPALAEQVPVLRGYKFVKLPDKVLFVAPSNRIVVGEVMK